MTKADKLAQVIREELVGTVGTCVCDEAYTSRNLRDPQCAWHNTDGDNLPAELAAVVLAHLTAEGWAQGREEEWGVRLKLSPTRSTTQRHKTEESARAEVAESMRPDLLTLVRRRVTDWEPVETEGQE